MNIKILSLLPLLLLLQACATSPSAVNHGYMVRVLGGSDAEARALAIAECKKHNPFTIEVSSISGRYREFKCRYWESNDDFTRPTSLQQRTMQSRRFNTSEKEIRNAISAWIAHSGASGGVTAGMPKIDEQGKLVPATEGRIFVMFTKVSPIFIIHGVYFKLGDEGIGVRLRTFVSTGTSTQDEIFSPKLYQLIFNQIAQELFTEAIPINPALMQ